MDIRCWLGLVLLFGIGIECSDDTDFIKKLLLAYRDSKQNENSSTEPVPVASNDLDDVDATTNTDRMTPKRLLFDSEHQPKTKHSSKEDAAYAGISDIETRQPFERQIDLVTEQSFDRITEQWFSHSGRDFHAWQDELIFPGSDFLLNMVDSYLDNGLYMSRIIKDPFRFDESTISDIGADISNVTSVLRDPEQLALIYTRRVTAYIQKERMLCAASKFDMMTTKAMMMEIEGLFADDDESMKDFLLTLLTELPSLPGLHWNAYSLANQITNRIHARVCNDTIHYILGRTYKDVTLFSGALYISLKKFFASRHIFQSSFVAIVTDIVTYDAIIKCPTDNELKSQRRDAMWDLTSKLEEVETTEICMGMRSFIEVNFFSSGTAPSIMASSHGYAKMMQDMCNYVKLYIEHFYMNVKEYQVMLMQRDLDGLKDIFQKYLSTDELLTLVRVLETLRWEPNIAIMNNVAVPKVNFSLPANHVLKHARGDIEFWQSFLDNLSPETFSQLDYADFKRSVKYWLEQKRKHIEEYTSLIKP